MKDLTPIHARPLGVTLGRLVILCRLVVDKA